MIILFSDSWYGDGVSFKRKIFEDFAKSIENDFDIINVEQIDNEDGRHYFQFYVKEKEKD